MVKESLNGLWKLSWEGMTCEEISGTVPGSVYSFLLGAGLMDDPFYRDNELKALQLMERDYVFTKVFDVPEGIVLSRHQVLRFDGIDTIADVFLNDVLLGHPDNMHCTWEYDVAGILRQSGNRLSVRLCSPTKYIREKDTAHHLGGSRESMRGFPHLRKAHFMFGWDWGPRLPDQGIWRDVSVIGWNDARIADVRIHEELRTAAGYPINEADDGWKAARSGDVRAELTVSVKIAKDAHPAEPDRALNDLNNLNDLNGRLSIRLRAPSGEEALLQNGVPFPIPDPQLWWPNGLGEQPLYQLEVICRDTAETDARAAGFVSDQAQERIVRRIGLRALTVQRKPDRWGETFAVKVNGRTFFAMGADYIPEDNILTRMSREKTEELLQMCADAHFNVIRVWGGGVYPSDDFYDLCDEKGLVVWQDLMFACANYKITPDYTESITREITQNVRRLRHHASLGLWCGNNEMEEFALEGEFDGTDETRADYLIQNEYIIPEILRREDPDTFYWPSSPSSGGKFDDPRSENRGDVHYWDVWHGNAPFTAYRSYYFRFLSEFGFQSFPCMETIRSFTLPQDRNVFSYVMEMHQRNSGANGKILQYLSQNYLYPGSLELLVYASQLLQADAIRYGVEHLRRGRNEDRCMGAVYWQLNDCWPVASWSSVDYYHRPKALQYAAKRFFAPVLLSCEEVSMASMGRACISEPDLQAPESNLNPTIKAPGNPYAVSMDHAIEAPERSHAGTKEFSAVLNVSNETWETVTDEVVWQVRDSYGGIVSEGSMPVCADPFSSYSCEKLDLSWIAPYEHHLYYYLRRGGQDGSVLFVPPKHYHFADPKLEIVVDEAAGTITVTAAAYAKGVEICGDGDLITEDNFFDMEPGSRTLKILCRGGSADQGAACGSQIRVRSVFDIR